MNSQEEIRKNQVNWLGHMRHKLIGANLGGDGIVINATTRTRVRLKELGKWQNRILYDSC